MERLWWYFNTSFNTWRDKKGLANLKSDVDKLNIDKLKNIPINLNTLKSKVDVMN